MRIERHRRLGLSRRRNARRRVLALLIATAGLGTSDAMAQLPTGADVVAGQAAISQAGNTLDVNAATSRAIVNWDSFNVGAGNTANFNLPSADSAILNRVTGANMPSTIAGMVNSNGHVMLVNPSGIMVSGSGMVNTNGFTASTFDVANQQFMAGGALTFTDNGSTGSIVNAGTISTGSGGAHLIANDIANHGTLTSNGGNITLSGGGRVTLNNGVTYSQPSLATLESGISPTAGLIQNTGTIRATGAATSGGEVYLVNPNGKILHDGTIAAQREPTALAAGTGISSAGPVASAVGSVGGHVQLEADEITLTENSSIDASGTHGGGDVLVGGDWQGGGAMSQATSVTMETGATIDASAIQSGDGGKIVLWSDVTKMDSFTNVAGTLFAKAGALFGNGGQIETSGHAVDTTGIDVHAGAANGDGGLWLIDPFNYLIDALAANDIVSVLNTGTDVTVTTTADVSTHGSSGNAGDFGDITIASDIVTGAMSGSATLTLKANRHISLAEGVVIDASQNGNTEQLNVKFWADQDNSGDGINIVRGSINTHGGSLEFGNGDTATLGGVSTLVGGDVYFNGSAAQTIQTGGGDVAVRGESILANTLGLTINTDGGDLTFGGSVDSGNIYTGVNSTLDWTGALDDADNVGGSYLATITSRLENALAGNAVNYEPSWLGGRRVAGIGTDSSWRWVSGPEGLMDGGNGLVFSNQSTFSGASSANGLFNNWSSGEPNNYNGFGNSDPFSLETESALQFVGAGGSWNDLPRTGSNLDWYVRETNLAASALTINAGGGSVVFAGDIGGNKALSNLVLADVGSLSVGGSLNLSGNLNIAAATGMNPAISQSGSWNVAGTSDFNTGTGNITLDRSDNDFGGIVSIAAAGDVSMKNSTNLELGTVTILGAFTAEAEELELAGNLTSSGTGDLFLKSNSATNSSILINGDILKTGGDRSTLTLQADGRVSINGDVTATGTSLDTVLWSDFHDTGSGGTSIFGSITTNGGHIWAGGSNSDGGSSIWNGLTVGDGASEGADGFNHNALDLYGSLATNGGDVLLWGGDGYDTGIDGIGINGDQTIDSGSGDVTIIANVVSGGTIQLNSSGAFTFAPHDNAWTTVGGELGFQGAVSSDTFTGASDVAWLKIANFSTLGGLTLGKDGMTSAVRILNAIDINGPINVFGSYVKVDEDLDTTGGTAASILLKATDYIEVAANTTMTTDGGDITLWSDSDSSDRGTIVVGLNSTFDSRTQADRTASTHTTGGGKITLAGGADNGSGAPAGFATAHSSDVNRSGISLGGVQGASNNTQLFSGGGDVLIKGRSSVSSRMGVQWLDGGTLNAGSTGLVNIEGVQLSSNGHGVEIGAYNQGGSTLIRTGGGSAGVAAVEITGTTSATNGDRGFQAGNLNVEAQGAGGVSIVGSSSLGFGLALYSSNFLSSNDKITLDGGTSGIRLGDTTIGRKAATTVATSVANIDVIGDSLDLVGTNNIDTSGTVTVQPSSTSFSSPLTWPLANLNVSSDISGLTLGKMSNTANITVNSAQSISGPINIYGGDITLNANLDTTGGGAAGDILLKATGDIVQSAGVAISTDSGDVTYWSDSSGSDHGMVFMDTGSSLDTSGGNVWMGGGTGSTSWNGMTVGDGYAAAGTARSQTGGGDWKSGIALKNVSINTSGGDLSMYGHASDSAGSDTGITNNGISTIDVGSGKFRLDATSAETAFLPGLHPTNPASLTITSSSAAADAISLHLDGSSGSGLGVGTVIEGDLTLAATGGGGVTIDALAKPGASAIQVGSQFGIGSLSVLANSGDIAINTHTEGLQTYSGTSTFAIGSKAGSAVTSSSSDITITADKYTLGQSPNINTTGTLTIEPFSASFASTLDWKAVLSGITGLTLGKSGNTAGISVSTNQSVAGDINIFGGDIAINAGLTSSGNHAVNIASSGNVTDGASGFIDADKLAITGATNTVLDNPLNDVNTIAFAGGAFSYLNKDALTIGTVGSTDGIDASGAIAVGTLTGDLTVSKDVETTDASTSAVTLNAGVSTAAGTATGGNLLFTNSSDVIVGSGGLAKLYSGDVSGSTGLTELVGSGSGNFRYNSDESTTNFSLALGSGLHAIYREQPSLTVTLGNESILFGDATPTWDLAFGNLVNGDTIAQAGITNPTVWVDGKPSSSGPYPIGIYATSTSGGSSQLGYAISSFTGGKLTVTPETIPGLGSTVNDSFVRPATQEQGTSDSDNSSPWHQRVRQFLGGMFGASSGMEQQQKPLTPPNIVTEDGETYIQ